MVDKFKNKEEAEQFIANTLRSKESLKDDPIKQKQIRINHAQLANVFVKIIGVAPISLICKKVMIAKISNPGITNLNIAIQLGIKEKDVNRYEEEGMFICKELLNRMDLQEATNKFNADDAIIKEANRLKGLSNPN